MGQVNKEAYVFNKLFYLFLMNVLPMNNLRKLYSIIIFVLTFWQSILASSCFNSQVIVAFETRLVFIMGQPQLAIRTGWQKCQLRNSAKVKSSQVEI